MSNDVKVRFSVGLLAIAMVVAVVHAVLSNALAVHSTKALMADQDRLEVPVYNGINDGGPIKTLPQPYPTNYKAQGEIKQQCGPDGCIVPSNPYGLKPGETLLHVGPARVVKPATNPVQPSLQAEQKRPEPKAYQVLLFLDGSAKSQDLINWFKSDPNLAKVKEASSFQVYTASNALYKERYSTLVAPTEFPAMVLQDASGGHIHACGKGMIPDSASELYDDLREAYGLYKQAKQGSTAVQAASPGAMKTEGYSWDNQILPAMRLQDLGDDCGPGGCDPPNWQPGERVRDGLDRIFNRDESRNALLWVSASELVLPALCGVLIILIFLIAYHKLKGQ